MANPRLITKRPLPPASGLRSNLPAPIALYRGQNFRGGGLSPFSKHNPSVRPDHIYRPSHCAPSRVVRPAHFPSTIHQERKRKLILLRKPPVGFHPLAIHPVDQRSQPPELVPVIANLAQLLRADPRIIARIENQDRKLSPATRQGHRSLGFIKHPKLWRRFAHLNRTTE